MSPLRTRSEDGSASLEGALACLVLMIVLMLGAAVGRLAGVNTSIENAAVDAARAASKARNASAARTAADAAISDTLSRSRVACQDRTVTVDTSAFASEPGIPGTITVTVNCHVPLANLPFIDGTDRTITATRSSPLDTYRERS